MKAWSQKYGPWAVVTGASDGIGRAFAKQLAARGMNLLLVARRASVLEDLAAELTRQHPIRSRAIPADLSTREGCETVIAQAEGSDVGLLVAAAGFGTSGPFVDNDLQTETNLVDVNCTSVVRLTHHFARAMQAKGRGGIVLFGSIVAFQGVPRAANYAASKAFVQTFAEGLRVELRPFGVDVIASAPGPVASGFAARADMQMGNAEKPALVAARTLQFLGQKTTVRPGFLSKLLGYSLGVLPRWGRVKIMTQVMGGMTQHQSAKANG